MQIERVKLVFRVILGNFKKLLEIKEVVSVKSTGGVFGADLLRLRSTQVLLLGLRRRDLLVDKVAQILSDLRICTSWSVLSKLVLGIFHKFILLILHLLLLFEPLLLN